MSSRVYLCLVGLVSAVSGDVIKGPVPTVQLNDGREMPAIALGTWLGNSTTGRIFRKTWETERAVMWALEAGYRHVDTAASYRVEDQVGRGLQRKIDDGTLTRNDVYITTKLWNNAHAQSAVVPALRASLARLGLAYVDLYLVHWPLGQFDNGTYDKTDFLETWHGMIEAKQLGLTRSIGVSNFNEQQIDKIRENGLQMPAVLQIEVNLNLQQSSLRAYCRRHQIAVMGYTPFGSLNPARAQPYAPPPRLDTPALVHIANKYNKTVPQIVLRYLVELDVVPLPKSLTRARIEENLQVFDFSLTPHELDMLKSYDTGYRTIPQLKWTDHPYYPFEKKLTAVDDRALS